MTAPKYIVGRESALATSEKDPRILEPGKGGNCAKVTQAIWFATDVGERWAFRVQRGAVEEFRTFIENERVYARLIPDDAVPALTVLDAQIEQAQAYVAKLQEERREMLSSLVPRAHKVKVPIVTKTLVEPVDDEEFDRGVY